ncbi:MAG: TIGR00730 family Rossman fold protein [Dialister pneumosintes]
MNKKNMTVTVYCGSHKGLSPTYTSFAQNFGTQLGKSGYRVAYGGGQLGLMGIIANAALDAGSHVTGIIPKVFVETEQAHYGVSRLEIVEDMFTRKKKLIEIGDAFVILPGGIGTLEEFVDTADWVHIYESIQKPIIIANVSGLFDPLKTLLDSLAQSGFITKKDWDNIHFCSSMTNIFSILDNYYMIHMMNNA